MITDKKFDLPGGLTNSQGSFPVAITPESGNRDVCLCQNLIPVKLFQNLTSSLRNIPVKLFQNLTSSFGEKSFLRISSCPYSAKSPISPEPYL